MIGFACDHGGLELKNALAEYAQSCGFNVRDFGTFSKESCDYPDFAFPCAKSVATGECDFGVVVCTTGIGMSICANKVKGVRCALCRSEKDAEMTRRHNNANIIAFGQANGDIELSKKILEIFLNTQFEGGRHQRRVDKITAEEK
ncbi:MAG: ribose 5-phosphate isomerase B [Clostridia bacterium]